MIVGIPLALVYRDIVLCKRIHNKKLILLRRNHIQQTGHIRGMIRISPKIHIIGAICFFPWLSASTEMHNDRINRFIDFVLESIRQVMVIAIVAHPSPVHTQKMNGILAKNIEHILIVLIPLPGCCQTQYVFKRIGFSEQVKIKEKRGTNHIVVNMIQSNTLSIWF